MGTSENVFRWSTTAASNDSADAGINWAENQSANTVNNSARGMMAALAKYLRDQHGYLTTGGSANAQTLTTQTGITALADGIEVGFVAGYTNTGATTLNVDSLGAKKLRKVDTTGETALVANDMVANGHYIARYDASADSAAGAWILLNPIPQFGVSGVSNSQLAQVATSTIKGRATAGTGNVEDLTLSQVLDMIGSAAQGDILYRGSSTWARLAAGTAGYVLQSNGAGANPSYVAAVGKAYVPILATAFTPSTTNGAALTSVEMTTNKNMLTALAFDASTSESAQILIPMPKSWNEGTVTYRAVWAHPSTTTNFGVVWELSGVAFGDDDAFDAAFGTGQTSTDTGGTTYDIYVSPESAAITIGGSPAEGDLVNLKIARLPSNGSDTLAVDAYLIAIVFIITTNAQTDD